MQTLILHIPDELARELNAEAKKTHLTKSEVARRRLIAAGSQSHDTASGFEFIADLIGTVEGGPADMSARKKEYLKTTGYGKARHRGCVISRRPLAEERSAPLVGGPAGPPSSAAVDHL